MIKFSKRMDPEVKKKFDKYGELFKQTLIRDLTEINKHRDIGNRITYENKMQLTSLIKQIPNYLVSYYVKASEYDNTDLCIMFDGVWRSYSKELESKLKIINKTKKDKTEIVVDYLCILMCVSCISNGHIDKILYEDSESSIDTLKRVIDAVGYNQFIAELYIQFYIMSIFKTILVTDRLYHQYKVVNVPRHLDLMEYSLFNKGVGNFHLTFSKNRLFRKMKELKYMIFKKPEDLNKYHNTIAEILNNENDMCKSMEEIRNFLYLINDTRIDDKEVTFRGLLIIGGLR